MIFDALGADRLKCAVADVQRDLDDRHTAIAKSRQQRCIEMQPRGRRGNRSRRPRKYCLVALAIRRAIVTLDIRRKRHVTDPLDRIVHGRVALRPQADGAASEESALENLAVESDVAFENDLRSWLQ